MFSKLTSILVFSLLVSFYAYGQSNKSGYLFGEVMFQPEKEGDYADWAKGVFIEIRGKDKSIQIITNEAGLIDEILPKGKYCLVSARASNGNILEFATDQRKCFEIKKGKTTRFPVVLLNQKK